MPFRTLATRIALPAGFFALVSIAALSYLLIRTQRENALEEAILGSEGLAETIYLTIDHDMRINRRDAIRETVEAVGRQSGIEGIRIFNKEGEISFSSKADEIGTTVDRQEEACVSCHSGPVPEATLHPDSRSRIFVDDQGHRVLGTIRVIPNKIGCQGSRCHTSPQQQSVLGVLDVALSLEPAEARLADSTWKAFLFSMVAVSLITGVLYWIIVRSVRRPLDTVVAATRRVAQGTTAVEMPRGTAPEIGILASSFNELIESLSSSRQKLEEWASSLEEKVSDKANELRSAQFQVVQAEKLASVGLVAAGIAHELNSPLMAIITFTHLVRSKVPPESREYEDLRMIEREANRCAVIIRQLLDFSRQQGQEPDKHPCRVAVSLQKSLDLLKVEIQNGEVTVRVELPEDLAKVQGNDAQLMQVFVNLVMNAVHAMPHGGELCITADEVYKRELALPDLPPDGAETLVRISFRDTGTGISRRDLTRVFDPFFTTKPQGKGSGLGLSVSMGIIRGFGGTMTVDSDGASWAEFAVLLPAAEEPAILETV